MDATKCHRLRSFFSDDQDACLCANCEQLVSSHRNEPCRADPVKLGYRCPCCGRFADEHTSASDPGWHCWWEAFAGWTIVDWVRLPDGAYFIRDGRAVKTQWYIDCDDCAEQRKMCGNQPTMKGGAALYRGQGITKVG